MDGMAVHRYCKARHRSDLLSMEVKKKHLQCLESETPFSSDRLQGPSSSGYLNTNEDIEGKRVITTRGHLGITAVTFEETIVPKRPVFQIGRDPMATCCGRKQRKER